MQVYANSNRHALKTILFFMLVLIIAFLPVSSFLFFLKNDAFTGYFPPKFFMSESIHAGHLPLWNPYINFGIPQYADMSSGYWSPFTWLIASTVGYNAYTLTIELLFYILAGGVGVYMLTGLWKLERPVRIIAGLAFMCSGYSIGHLQHFNWLSGSAFLPWCLWSYMILLDKVSFRNILRCALVFYLFVSSAHPGITISAFYFFAGYLGYHLFKEKKVLKGKIKSIALGHIFFLAVFILISGGMITAYLDVLPHFVRADKLSLEETLLAPTTIQCWLSSLLPFAVTKNSSFFDTDIAMRNCYFSLALLLFLKTAVLSKKSPLQKFFFTAGVVFVLLSLGGIFKTFAYKFIPFIGYIRLNGEFRIFAILCFILMGALELDKYVKEKKSFRGALTTMYYVFQILVIAAIIFGIYAAVINRESFVYNLINISGQPGIALKLKSLTDSLSFYDTLWMQGTIQLFLLWGIKWCLRAGNWQLLVKIVALDLVLASLLNIPFTGVGKTSVANVQTILNGSPKGIPVPQLTPLTQNERSSPEEESLVGNWSMYNKQPGTTKFVLYPIMLKNMMAYFDDTVTRQHHYEDKAFLFTTSSLSADIKVQSFSPQRIDVAVQTNDSSQLILQQNFYPHWYYISGKEKKEAIAYGTNFMSAPVHKGTNKIIFSFEPGKIIWTMLLSAVAFVVCCLLLLIPVFRRSSPSLQQQQPGP